ncbi:ankyrin repeat-containing protein At5g02620-like [Pistacia vera]|uniref:ankyrin repeat-containing protein At5g02620-like n=1 Tax=Pistacia vera TaxID=55513 RepID=UPI001263D646|nr:ankyrin repeat-containing protein At5g02620-like [Pistacia vera]
MLRRNEELLKTRGGQDMTPIYLAAIFGDRRMALYLYGKVKTMEVNLRDEDKASLFFACLYTALYDVAMDLLKDLPALAMFCDGNKDTALHILARQPSSFAGSEGLLKRLISSCPGVKNNNKTESASTKALELVRCLLHSPFSDEKLLSKKGELEDPNLNFMFDAAKLGNFEFLNMFISRYPHLVDKLDENSYSIFHIAIIHRHADIFNLIFGIVDLNREVMTTLVDEDKNNILHLAAKLPHSSRLSIVSGAALQMQRELLWFKEIEKVVKPSHRKNKNSSGKTPQELFTEEHKGLLRDGESWMKKTASSCMLVATIVTSVIFAAAFSVPGGYEDKTGIPNLLKDNLFQVFSISNAIALSSSIISVLMFLSILTSRYTEGDFLRSLPLKLIGGLLSLYVALVTMMIAFIISFLLAYHDRLNLATITTILMSVAATLFVQLQYPLLRDTFCSTYNSRFLFKSSTAML